MPAKPVDLRPIASEIIGRYANSDPVHWGLVGGKRYILYQLADNLGDMVTQDGKAPAETVEAAIEKLGPRVRILEEWSQEFIGYGVELISR